MEQKNDKRVVFRRVHGRIIPIAVGTAGAGVALNAANTTRIYQKGAIAIDKKKFAFAPFANTIGTKLNLKVNGKQAGKAIFFRGADDSAKSFGFAWLGIKRAYRGEGLSKVLSKESAKEIRRQGGTYLFNQVVHPGSLKTNLTRRDTFYKVTDIASKKVNKFSLKGISKAVREFISNEGYSYSRRVGRHEALKNINWHRSRGDLTSDIFRRTNIKGIHYKSVKSFRTLRNKFALAGGAAIALGSIAYLAATRKGNNEKR